MQIIYRKKLNEDPILWLSLSEIIESDALLEKAISQRQFVIKYQNTLYWRSYLKHLISQQCTYLVCLTDSVGLKNYLQSDFGLISEKQFSLKCHIQNTERRNEITWLKPF